jgi:hypothetical protein
MWFYESILNLNAETITAFNGQTNANLSAEIG